MKRLKLTELGGQFEKHFLEKQVGGEWIKGGLSFKEAGTRTHDRGCDCASCDGEGHHLHDDCEVFIFLAGRAVMEVDGRDYEVGPGEIVICEPGEDHHVRAEEACVNLWLHAADGPG